MPETLLQLMASRRTSQSGLMPLDQAACARGQRSQPDLRAGETLGIVGESGFGKSTLLRMILRLHAPDCGHVLFEGRDIGGLRGRELRHCAARCRRSSRTRPSSFNPRQSGRRRSCSAPLEVHGMGTREDADRRSASTLDLVGLNATSWTAIRISFPADSGSAWRSHGPSFCDRRWFWPTSRPRRSTSRSRRKF